MTNEIAPSNWGMKVNDLVSSANNNIMYLAIPYQEQCYKWSDSNTAKFYRLRFRWHGDVANVSNRVKVRAKVGADPNDTIEYYDHTGGADEWDATWAAANETNMHPEAKPLPTVSDESKCPAYFSPKLRFQKEDSTDGSINGVEIGAVNDTAHAAPDLDCILADRAGAERMYTALRPACSWLISDALCHTFNRLTEFARWRMSCPMAGYR
ncbi:MAG: hypothetical protein GY851_09260 [bacterium]|nr:hypothetical protein [bacterium]